MKDVKALTVAKAIQAYLAELSLAGRSPRTVSFQTWLLQTFAKAIVDRPIDSITRTDVMAYLGDMAARRLSQSYIGINGKTIKRFLAWAVEQGILESNPLQGMKIGMGPDKPFAPFTDDECRRLIAAADTPLKKAAILLLLDSGIRASELCSLRLQGVNLCAGEITVLGKGAKTRKLALNDRPRQALEEYLADRAQQDGLVWPPGFDRMNLGTLVDSVARRAHVCCCHPHRFRHNWSVRMRRAGVDAIALQTLLGHSSLKMTMRYVAYVEGEVAVEVHHHHCVLPA